MAGFALTTVAARMVIFAQMATNTFTRQTIFEVFPGVAILAVQSAMAIIERKTRFQKMVKPYALPGRRGVTVVTGRAIPSAMNIVNRMAADALRWRAVKYVASMAVDAFDCGVLACQAVSDRVVIETRIRPVAFVVAALAVVAK